MTTTTQKSGSAYKVISHGDVTGEYQGFPDACRLQNGDIAVVFYAGYDHVSFPNEAYPNGGKICLTRSSDEGRTWSESVVIYDDEYDNRDPHIAQLSNGTLICSFFSLSRCNENPQGYQCTGPQIIRSFDGGNTWEAKGELIPTDSFRRWHLFFLDRGRRTDRGNGLPFSGPFEFAFSQSYCSYLRIWRRDLQRHRLKLHLQRICQMYSYRGKGAVRY